MVDAGGGVANFTGSRCIAEAGGKTGKGYAVQANLMANGTVPDAMAAAYEAATGPLAERLLAALAGGGEGRRRHPRAPVGGLAGGGGRGDGQALAGRAGWISGWRTIRCRWPS